jgi:aryl-alcohol dehydrogenase-like predicted oxidoreductase
MKLLGREVAPLGMGCWGIGGRFFAGNQPLGFPDLDSDEAIRVLHAALDAGISVFDTAAVYGAGQSERRLGTALKGRSEVVVISKLGTAFDEETRQVLGDRTDPGDIAAAIEDSLRRLQRDCIDVMLLHLNGLPVATAMPIFEEMERAHQSGKIRAYGWSTDFPASAAAMAQMPGFVGVEHAMNVFVDVPSIQSVVEQQDLVAFIRSPLAMGLLTGKYDETSVVSGDDVRSVNSERRDYFRDGKASPKYLTRLEALRDLLRTGGRTLAQGALGWLMAKSDRNVPLPGARTVAQVRENADALRFGPLPQAVMAEIEIVIRRDPEGKPQAR